MMPLDPILQQMIDQLPKPAGGPPDYPAMRAQAEAMLPLVVGPAGLAEVASVVDERVDDGGATVPLRIYTPVGEPQGLIHYIHGGGWAVGNLATIDPTARRLCRDLSFVVVTSTYRLAPENPFPAAFDDSLAAARWVMKNGDRLVANELPRVIGGDSAGGNLAAAVCIAMRDAGDPAFDAQLVLYPAVDLRLDGVNYPSRTLNADPGLTSETVRHCYADYAGGTDLTDPRLSPLLAPDLTGLPPAVIVVVDVDPLRDEGRAFATALRDAGNRVELVEVDNLVHGYTHLAGIIPAAAEVNARVEARLKSLLAEVGSRRT